MLYLKGAFVEGPLPQDALHGVRKALAFPARRKIAALFLISWRSTAPGPQSSCPQDPILGGRAALSPRHGEPPLGRFDLAGNYESDYLAL
jgi:hypothetical protein